MPGAEVTVRSRRAGEIGTWTASRDSVVGLATSLGILIAVMAVDIVLPDRLFPMTAVVIAPLVASVLAVPAAVAVVAVAALLVGVVLGIDEGIIGTGEHLLRLGVIATVGFLAVWLSDVRVRKEAQLVDTARGVQLGATLQTTLAPDVTVEAADIFVVTRSRPAENLMLLGGDFFDVVDCGTEGIAFVVGDVSGHGPTEAALGASMRATWRASALSGLGPAACLEVMERVLEREARCNPDVTFVTACAGTVSADRTTAHIACAGHHAPIVLTAANVEPMAVCGEPVLGVLSPAPIRTATSLALGEQWSLLVYTDGLTEGLAAPDSKERFGEARLVAWLSQLGGHRLQAGDIDALLATVEAANGGPMRDDVAVVMLRHDPQAHDGGTITLPPAPDAARSARRFVTSVVAPIIHDVDRAEVLELLVGEVVANAVRHARTDIDVTVHLLGDRVRVDIGDRSSEQPTLNWSPGSEGGFGLHIIAKCARDWGVLPRTGGGKVVWFEV